MLFKSEFSISWLYLNPPFLSICSVLLYYSLSLFLSLICASLSLFLTFPLFLSLLLFPICGSSAVTPLISCAQAAWHTPASRGLTDALCPRGHFLRRCSTGRRQHGVARRHVRARPGATALRSPPPTTPPPPQVETETHWYAKSVSHTHTHTHTHKQTHMNLNRLRKTHTHTHTHTQKKQMLLQIFLSLYCMSVHPACISFFLLT